MKPVLAATHLLYVVNDRLLMAGRFIGVLAVGAMVVAILVQVFFRYVLNNALPWPDEAARFCMLWMTGLMAPTAFRRGGFVAIDTLTILLPKMVAALLSLVLLMLSLLVLVVALDIGYNEVTGLGGRFATASLYVPTSFGFDQWYRVPRSWMMLSMVVGLALLILVNVELILHRLLTLLGLDAALPSLDDVTVGGAE